MVKPIKRVSFEEDWAIRCPKCNRQVGRQTIFVTEYRDPKFKCKFCDAKGELIAVPGKSKFGAGK